MFVLSYKINIVGLDHQILKSKNGLIF